MTHKLKPDAAAPSPFAQLFSPISADLPCGADLEYDPAFLLLLARLQPRDAVQYGNFTSAPEPLGWTEIERDCRSLLTRTRDIRLLIVLIRCGCRAAGAQGLYDGLRMLHDMLTTFPDDIHPQLQIEGEHDPVMRANAMTTLTDRTGLLSDIRDLTFGDKTLRLQIREIERALAVPRPDDAATPEVIQQRLDTLRQITPAQMAAIDGAWAQATVLQRWCEQTLPRDAVDLGPLIRLLQLAARPAAPPQAGQFADDAGPAADPDTENVGTQAWATDTAAAANTASACGATSAATVWAPVTRQTVLGDIRAARKWFEENEPSSPVALLLRQAERLIGKPFAELFQAIPSDLVESWSREANEEEGTEE